MDLINETKLSGQIIKVYPIKQTPYGLPVLCFVLEHVSNQIEAGVSRSVKCRIYCIIIDWQDNLKGNLEQRFVMVSGFLSLNSKASIVLNVKQIYE